MSEREGGQLVWESRYSSGILPEVKSFRIRKLTNFIAVYLYPNKGRFQNPILSLEETSTALIQCPINNFLVVHFSESNDFISLQLFIP